MSDIAGSFDDADYVDYLDNYGDGPVLLRDRPRRLNLGVLFLGSSAIAAACMVAAVLSEVSDDSDVTPETFAPRVVEAPPIAAPSVAVAGLYGTLDGAAEAFRAKAIYPDPVGAPKVAFEETSRPLSSTPPTALPPLPPSRMADLGPNTPLSASRSVAPDEAVPLPPANPFRPRSQAKTTEIAKYVPQPGPRIAGLRASAPSAPVTGDNKGFFEKLFDSMKQPDSKQGPALAYANPNGGFGGPGYNTAVPPSGVGGGTAVYDISAHVVYMPNGAKLEAHSGLGNRLDDVNSVAEKNRGVTPPQTYDLTMREELFHGVRALRMNPVDNRGMYGRDGILAHSYMLGPNGDSNGCVSFRDYPQFLNAFLRGEVKRLVVVTRSGANIARNTVASRI
jgi:hypothetical protein